MNINWLLLILIPSNLSEVSAIDIAFGGVSFVGPLYDMVFVELVSCWHCSQNTSAKLAVANLVYGYVRIFLDDCLLDRFCLSLLFLCSSF